MHQLTIVILAALVVSVSQSLGEVKSIPFKLPEYGFCVAYSIRDADRRDERPTDPDGNDPFGDDDPFVEGETRIPPNSLLWAEGYLDIASLTSRTIKQKQLNEELSKRLLFSVYNGESNFPAIDCYDPHHIFIFYSFIGTPVSCIEVCLTCNAIRVADLIENKRVNSIVFQSVNYLTIARIISELGLDLTPYKSVEDFMKKKRLKKQ